LSETTAAAPAVAMPRPARGDGLVALGLVGPIVVLLAALVIFPLVYTVYVSFHSWDLFSSSHPSIGFKHYSTLIHSGFFWYSVKLMFIYGGAALAAELVLGYLLAVLMFTRLPLIGLVRTLFMIPILIAPIVVGLIWRLMLEPSYGILAYFLRSAGATSPAWVSDPGIALWSVVLVDVWEWTPFVFLVVLAGLHSIPAPIEEAAELDGARPWHKTLYINLPLLKRILLVVVLLRGIDLLRAFDLIYVMTRGGPGTSSITLPFSVWNQGFVLFDIGAAASQALVVVIIISVVTFFLIRIFRKSFTAPA
jgi:multiple sugar transport system permease protein